MDKEKSNSDKIRKFIRQVLMESNITEIRNGKPEEVTVYHGTSMKNVNSIKSNGLNAGSMGYDYASWYMVSTDFESALFHATAEEREKAPVIEFKVPVDNTKWEGYPYFWPPYERSSNSKWFALKNPLTNDLIKKIHYVDYEDFFKVKSDKLFEGLEGQSENKWVIGGVIFIYGEKLPDGTRRLYATTAKNKLELKKREDKQDTYDMAILGNVIKRIAIVDGKLKANNVDWRSKNSQLERLGLNGPSVAINENKTPLHWESLYFNDIDKAINMLSGQIMSLNNVKWNG